MPTLQQRTEAQQLVDFIAASPSPWHAVSRASAELDAAGFTARAFALEQHSGGRYAIEVASSK